MIDYQTIVQGIINALQPLQDEGLVQEIRPFNGEFLSSVDMEKQFLRLPAILVFVASMENDKRGLVDIATYTVVLTVLTEGIRDEDLKTVYDILVAIREKLHRKRILKEGEPFFLVSEKILDIEGNTIIPARAIYEFRHRKMNEIT